MQLSPNALQNKCYYKFVDIHKKVTVLESLSNKVTGLIACNFIKKEALKNVCCCEYDKILFLEHLLWLLLRLIEVFLRISKGGFPWIDLYNFSNLNI